MHDRLLALRESSGLSFARLILRTLGEVELEVDSARRLGEEHGLTTGMEAGLAKGREDGFADAVAKYRIGYACAKCGEDIVIGTGSPSAKAAAAWLHEKGWAHRECPVPT